MFALLWKLHEIGHIKKSGVVATTVAAPFDTLKSRVMVDDGQGLGSERHHSF